MLLPESNPMFASKADAEFRIRMREYISASFSDVPGKDARRMQQPGSLGLIQAKVNTMLTRYGMRATSVRKAA